MDDETRGDIRWRILRAGMWAARRDGRHLGTVERGHRFLAVDADSEPIGRFRTLGEAQAAVATPSSYRAAPVPAPVEGGAAAVLAAATTASAVVIALAWPVLTELIR